MVPLLGLSLFLGFYPRPVLDRIGPSVKAVIVHVERTTDYEAPTPSAREIEESPAGPETEEAE